MIALVQRAANGLHGRRARFSAFFGDRLNPFYHLGAISFFLFWIVAGSGVYYLYAFFGTSVADAISQALTHRQWFAGRYLRSIHRYASGIVLTMVLHLVRHFAFDRFSGFRAFSWLTGLMLLWLVYVAGVNGYMLPWDRLAQFVIVTVVRMAGLVARPWRDMIRNVISSSINDRFFSLLWRSCTSAFHCWCSLLMWVHVQRVPKAKTLCHRGRSSSACCWRCWWWPCSRCQWSASRGLPRFEHVVASVDLDWFPAAAAAPIERLPALYVTGWLPALLRCLLCCRGCVATVRTGSRAKPQIAGSTKDRRATGRRHCSGRRIARRTCLAFPSAAMVGCGSACVLS